MCRRQRNFSLPVDSVSLPGDFTPVGNPNGQGCARDIDRVTVFTRFRGRLSRASPEGACADTVFAAVAYDYSLCRDGVTAVSPGGRDIRALLWISAFTVLRVARASFEGPTREGAQGRSGNRVLRRNDGYARCPSRLSRARPEGRASRLSPIFAGVAVDPSRCLDRLSAASLSEERRGSSYSSGAVKVIFGPFPTAVLQPLDGRKPNTLMVRFGVAYDRAVFPRPPFDGLTRRHGYRAMAQTRRHSPCERSALPIGLSTDRPRRARISGFARGRECRSIRCPILP
jgi:hypothetical protein